jgi:hypothetical protein
LTDAVATPFQTGIGRGATGFRQESPLAFNNISQILEASIDGCGWPTYRKMCPNHLLKMADWCPPFSGYHLHCRSRWHPSPAFTLLVDALRHNPMNHE